MDPTTGVDAGEPAARQRLEVLFRTFDRLTPDELGRIGYRLAYDVDRDPLLAALDEAALRTGRVALRDEARHAVREAVILDAMAIANLAVGEASDGSLAQAIRDPDDPELRLGPGTRRSE